MTDLFERPKDAHQNDAKRALADRLRPQNIMGYKMYILEKELVIDSDNYFCSGPKR